MKADVETAGLSIQVGVRVELKSCGASLNSARKTYSDSEVPLLWGSREGMWREGGASGAVSVFTVSTQGQLLLWPPRYGRATSTLGIHLLLMQLLPRAKKSHSTRAGYFLLCMWPPLGSLLQKRYTHIGISGS